MKKILFTILINFIFILNVFANPYKKTQTINGITTIPCTYVAWDQAYSKMGVSLPGWGNAIS